MKFKDYFIANDTTISTFRLIWLVVVITVLSVIPLALSLVITSKVVLIFVSICVNSVLFLLALLFAHWSNMGVITKKFVMTQTEEQLSTSRQLRKQLQQDSDKIMDEIERLLGG